jgi:hypothetical protein
MPVTPCPTRPPRWPRVGAAFAVTAALSAGAGWSARGDGGAARVAAGPVSPPIPVVAPALSLPHIAVARDGQVTLRVEQQPLAWVLEQIARQGGLEELRVAAADGAVASAPAATAWPPAGRAPAQADPLVTCAPPPPADPAQVLQALSSADEAERFVALMQAQSDAIQLPDAVLSALYESDPSERVRVAALEIHLAQLADWPDAVRALLEAARHSPSSELRAEAGRRLDELDERARLAALPPAPDP